eukprot:1670295-Rhodomonas_salina.1
MGDSGGTGGRNDDSGSGHGVWSAMCGTERAYAVPWCYARATRSPVLRQRVRGYQNIANTLWALATLERGAEDKVVAAVGDSATAKVAPCAMVLRFCFAVSGTEIDGSCTKCYAV